MCCYFSNPCAICIVTAFFFFLSRLYAYARISLAPQTRVSLCDFSKRGDHIAIFASIHLQFPTEGTLYYTYPRGRNGNMDWVGGITRAHNPRCPIPFTLFLFLSFFPFFFRFARLLHQMALTTTRQYEICTTRYRCTHELDLVRTYMRACVRACSHNSRDWKMNHASKAGIYSNQKSSRVCQD